MTLWKRLSAGGAMSLVLLIALMATALAHTSLVGSEPTNREALQRAPDRVRLFFNEPIKPESFTLEVYRDERIQVDRRNARILPENPAALEVGLGEVETGIYTVVWRVFSIDNHLALGTFVFTVGAGTAPGTALRRDSLLVARPTKNKWPKEFWQATPEAQKAYRFAVANPHILQYIPCYCGCVNQGHTSNKDCYIDEIRPDGSVVLDPMSFG